MRRETRRRAALWTSGRIRRLVTRGGLDVVELSTPGQLYDSARSLEEYATGYIARMTEVVHSMDNATVVKAIEIIEACAEKDQTFFILGNGGSGAVGGHWVNDLGANTVVDGKPGFRVISLCDNPFSITAIANDAQGAFSFRPLAG